MATLANTRANTRALDELIELSRRRGGGHGLSVWEAMRVALEGLAANKMRSLLTMLGIIIGVAAVITTVSIGQGANRAAQQQIARMGTNVLQVIPGAQRTGAVSQGLGSRQSLKLEDAEAIARQAPSVRAVAPEYSARGQVKYLNQNTSTSILGTTPEYMEMRNFQLAEGRFLTKTDVKRRAKVVILGDTIRDTLFADVNPVGKTLKISGQNFRVVGVFRPKGGSGFRSPDDQVYVPITRRCGVSSASISSVRWECRPLAKIG